MRRVRSLGERPYLLERGPHFRRRGRGCEGRQGERFVLQLAPRQRIAGVALGLVDLGAQRSAIGRLDGHLADPALRIGGVDIAVERHPHFPSEVDRAALREKDPDAILLSAKSPADVAALRETIISFFEASMVEDELVLPYAKQGMLSDVYENARVLSEDYDATGRIMKVRGLPGAIARLRRNLAAS